MPLPVSNFFVALRNAFLNDTTDGRRFTDDILAAYLTDALLTLYTKEPACCYGLPAASQDSIAALAASLTPAPAANGAATIPAEVLQTDLFAYIHPGYLPLLRAQVWKTASASNQRGQERSNPLATTAARAADPATERISQ